MEKRYMVFTWQEWEAWGGMSDYRFSFDTLEEFKNHEDSIYHEDVIQIHDTKNNHTFSCEDFDELHETLETYMK